MDTDGAQKDHIRRKGRLELLIHHGISAIFHHHYGVPIVLEPWEGIRQDSGALVVTKSAKHSHLLPRSYTPN